MPRIRPLEYHEVEGPVREEYDRQIAAHGRMTNMKRTLAHSPIALRALMEWYALQDEVRPFLGERLTHLFVHAISAETDCLICSTFFRRILIESGENPETLEMDEREQAVVRFGRQLVGTHGDAYAFLDRQLQRRPVVLADLEDASQIPRRRSDSFVERQRRLAADDDRRHEPHTLRLHLSGKRLSRVVPMLDGVHP